MSRLSSSRQPDTRSPANATPSRRPSPTTLAAANAEQAATSVAREASFKDGVLIILSYDTENIFIFSNLSYEHVLESALANFSALKHSRIERSQIRLAVQTKIGNVDTLVQVTPDTWPAVAARAQVVTVLVQQPSSSSPSLRGSSSHIKLPPPPVPCRLASPQRDSEPASWSGNSPPPHHPTWHPPYPPTAYTTSAASLASPGEGSSLRSQPHSRRRPQSGTAEPTRTQYPYAQAHYIPSGPNAVSPTTDVSFIGVRPIVDTDLRRERPEGCHTEPPPKRRWDQLDDAGTEERAYGPGPHGSSSRQQFGPPAQHEDARKPRRGPDGPKTLCNACGLSYAKDAARREAAASASTSSVSAQAPSAQAVSERPAPYAYDSDATNSNNSRAGRGTGVKTLDGTSTTPSTIEGAFPGPAVAVGAPLSSVQPLRKCTMCKRTDSPQWRKGPEGPNTLCNSCGLQWARTQRKSEGTHSRAASPRSPSPTAALKTASHVPPPVSTSIGTGASLAESATGRPAPRPQPPSRNDRDADDEHRRPPSAASHRSDSPEDSEAQPSS
ncbi:blue light receptor [Ceratobasidium sp. 423]|nr:blue light receptor [Ceratobasidium sp. 423]